MSEVKEETAKKKPRKEIKMEPPQPQRVQQPVQEVAKKEDIRGKCSVGRNEAVVLQLQIGFRSH
jgi:hypothetical protein